MSRNNLPGYLKHKTTGQALCVIHGRFIYLGKYGSKASRLRYKSGVFWFAQNLMSVLRPNNIFTSFTQTKQAQ